VKKRAPQREKSKFLEEKALEASHHSKAILGGKSVDRNDI
jgi:hypothetical protein